MRVVGGTPLMSRTHSIRSVAWLASLPGSPLAAIICDASLDAPAPRWVRSANPRGSAGAAAHVHRRTGSPLAPARNTGIAVGTRVLRLQRRPGGVSIPLRSPRPPRACGGRLSGPLDDIDPLWSWPLVWSPFGSD